MVLTQWQKQVMMALLCLPAPLCCAVADALPADMAVASAYADTSRMQVMDDSELEETSGQALFNMSYLAPGDANNYAANNTASNKVGFYKVGIEGELALNANIRKLQLGCGGFNGAGGCDIDIDNFSLSGSDGSTRAGRVSSDAILTNPFFQFAIKNPDNPATRELVGFRISSEAANALLTFGEENLDTPNGINSLSGYLNIGSASGDAQTVARTMSKADTGRNMTGRIRITDVGGATLNFSSDTYNLSLAQATAHVTTQPTVVYGKRMSSVNLNGTATIDPISFSGTMTATVIGIDLKKNVTGSISGLSATVPIEQSLGYIHKLQANGNPFSMSLQGQDLRWPGSAQAAMKGWWMAFEDQIDIGNISPASQVAITNAVLQQALGAEDCSSATAPGINCALYRNPIECKAFGSPNCFGGDLPVGNVDITGTSVNFPLSNLKLSAQTFAPNCWGTSKFC